MGEGADLGFALLGAGTFARLHYLPLLNVLPVNLKAVWSRSQEAAVEVFSQAQAVYPNAEPKWGEEGLEEILQDPSVRGVFVVLPPQVQLQIVSRALQAGKHVLQEKPVGSSVQEVLDVIRMYDEVLAPRISAPIWAVGENYRFEPGLIAGAVIVAEDIGRYVNVQVIVESPMQSSNPYYKSAWRRDPAFQGAFIKDGGVHFVAGLRLITGLDVISVNAITTHADPSLPPPDTVSAIFTLENGCPGVLVMSWASTSRQVLWRVVGTEGTVEVSRGTRDSRPGYLVTHLSSTEAKKETEITTTVFYPFEGLQEEVKCFVRDVIEECATEDAEPRSSVAESLHDLAVIEALLESGANGGRTTTVPRTL